MNAGPQSADAEASTLHDLKWQHLAFLELLDPITILLTSDNQYVWASSISGVFKARMDAEKMVLVGYLAHEVNLQFHGAYAFVDANDQFFAAGNDYIAVYGDADPADPESGVVLVRKHSFAAF